MWRNCPSSKDSNPEIPPVSSCATLEAPNSLWASITLQTLKYQTVNHSICHDIHPPHPHPSILALLRTVLGFQSFPFQLHNLHTPAQPCRNRQWLKEKGPTQAPNWPIHSLSSASCRIQTSALVNTTPTTSKPHRNRVSSSSSETAEYTQWRLAGLEGLERDLPEVLPRLRRVTVCGWWPPPHALLRILDAWCASQLF